MSAVVLVSIIYARRMEKAFIVSARLMGITLVIYQVLRMFVKGGKNGMKANMDYETLRNSMTVQDAARVLEETHCFGTMDIAKNVILKALDDQLSSSEKPNKWIPFIKRPMTEEEREEYEERTGIEETMIFNCPLPEDGEEVLVSYGDYVTITTFYEDGGGVCYFDIGDINKAEAWMPLPAPFKSQERDNENCDDIWERTYREREGKK